MMPKLDSPPSILPLYVKAALPLLPGPSALPFVPGGGGEIPPEIGFEIEDVVPDPDQVAAYSKVCGFTLRETLPPTFPHILAFPLHMALMSDGAFPFGAVGLVHIGNSITRLKPIEFGQPLSVRVKSTPLSPHPKGRVFSLLTEVATGGQTVWTETSTMLRRGGGESGSPREGSHLPEVDPATPSGATWKLPGDLGRRYGAVSGDRNPIHMYDLTAKAFGFRSAIAHGMWTKARALAQIETRLPDSFTAEVRFRQPLFIPASVDFFAEERDGEILFAVRDSRRSTPHLSGITRTNTPQTQKASSR